VTDADAGNVGQEIFQGAGPSGLGPVRDLDISSRGYTSLEKRFNCPAPF
jgi:hypothetical protein